MQVPALRKLFAHRPYRPLEIVLDNGGRFVVPHPESIIITSELVFFVPSNADVAEIVAPEAISQVRATKSATRGNGSRRRG